MTDTDAHIIQVAVKSPLTRLFDYLPGDLSTPCVGARVWVPFGRRRVLGVVIDHQRESSVPAKQLKPILSCLDDTPILSAHGLALARWCSDYYHYPLGEVLHAMLPARLRQGLPRDKVLRAYQVSARGLAAISSGIKAPKQRLGMQWLSEQNGPVTKQQMLVQGISYAVVRALVVKSWLEELMIQASAVGEPSLAVSVPSVSDLSASESVEPEGGHGAVNETLVEAETPHERLTLNEAQARAVAAIDQARGFASFLLDGVTGSGKTEVYLRAMSQVIAQGRQVLVLVPEIGLTPQTIKRFRARFQVLMVVWHSHMTDSERAESWRLAQSGQAKIVIGTRSAVFADMPDLAMIIVDEAHDASFKQQTGLRYSAVDLARVRASKLLIPVVLGSATPSLSCLAGIGSRLQHLLLPKRAGSAQMPRISLVDLRGQTIKNGLSNAMMAKISEHIAAGNQVLIFLNQRGFAPTLICHQCGWLAKCQRCDVKLTLHASPRRLLCHHCGAHWHDHDHCQSCASTDVMPLGTGTMRLEEALRKQFPDQPLVRVDRDSTKLKGQLDEKLDKIHRNEAKILVGTQMLAKGHHFPHLTLVAVVNIDDSFFSSDFRAVERVGQLFTQVAGRAGRADLSGEVILQSHQPDHPLLQILLKQGYHAFASALLQERKVLGLPPYGYMALLRAEATSAHLPEAFLAEVVEKNPAESGLCLLGPMPAPIGRKAGHYRYYILMWSSSRKQRHLYLKRVMAHIETMKLSRRVRWCLDVDPIDLI